MNVSSEFLTLLAGMVASVVTYLLGRRASNAAAALKEATAAKIIENTSSELLIRMSADLREHRAAIDALESKLALAQTRIQQLENEKRQQQVEIEELRYQLTKAQTQLKKYEKQEDGRNPGGQSLTPGVI